MKLTFLVNAKLDFLEGIEWFESISEGLGDQFEFEFFKCVDRIRNGPLNFAQNETGLQAKTIHGSCLFPSRWRPDRYCQAICERQTGQVS